MSEVDKTIARIRKLNAKAESAKALGSEAEADTFASAVQRMLAQYQLSLTDIQFEERKATEPIDRHIVAWEEHGLQTKRSRIEWIERLSLIIARANHCQILVISGSSKIALVGRKSDRDVAEFVIVTMVRTAESIADKEYVRFFYKCKDAGDVTKARGFRKSFLHGFVSRIETRYRELENEIYKEHGNMAVVRFNDARNDVQKYVEGLSAKTTHALTRSTTNRDGYIRGVEYADKMSLKANAVHNTTTQRHKLS